MVGCTTCENSSSGEKWWLRVLDQTPSLQLLSSCSAFLHVRHAGEVQQVLPEGNIFLSAGLDSYQWIVTSQNRQVAN